MKIIGAGYGRTGTKSLQLALEALGFGKCYHMEELLRNPEGVVHWQNAYEEKKVDWDTLFQNYNSIVDFPGSMYYKDLAKQYPDAKIILTVRDPEKWYQSVKSTIYSFEPSISVKLKMIFMLPFLSIARNILKVIILNKKSIWQKFFEGKFEDKEYSINKFQNHIEEVKEHIPADKLLVFSAREGWDPLCRFLGVPVPEQDYPSTNKGVDFAEWATGVVKESLNQKRK